MGEQSNDLERHIEDRRNRLNENISELERKAKDALDWRVQVEQRPGTMIGLAFGAGILLSAVLGGTRSSTSRKATTTRDARGASVPQTERSTAQSMLDTAYEGSALARAWDNITGAVLGVAVSKVESLLEDLLPGIADQYHKAEARNKANGWGAATERIN